MAQQVNILAVLVWLAFICETHVWLSGTWISLLS